MRLRSLDSGRLFSAKIASSIKPSTQLYTGDFAEPFPPPLRGLLWSRRSSLRRAPQGLPQPLTRGRGEHPCTCPASPFMAKPGLCVTHRLATKNRRFVTLSRPIFCFRLKISRHLCHFVTGQFHLSFFSSGAGPYTAPGIIICHSVNRNTYIG